MPFASKKFGTGLHDWVQDITVTGIVGPFREVIEVVAGRGAHTAPT
jgi:hypothetical protein